MKKIYINIIQMIQYACHLSTKSERQIIEKQMSESDEFMDQMIIFYDIIHHPDLKEWELWKPAYSVTSEIICASKETVQKTANKVYNWIKNQRPPEWTLMSPMQNMQLCLVSVPARNRRKIQLKRDKYDSFDFVEFKTHLEDFGVNIYVEKSGKNLALIKIQVHQQKKLIQNIRIFLKKDDISCPWARLQSDQYALFENIPFGIFRMTLKKKSESIGEYRFRIDSKGVKTNV